MPRSDYVFAAYGHPPRSKPFTEEDWSDLNNPSHPVPAYPKSKTLAERAAWDWIAEHRDGMDLAVVNPVGIWGPVLGKDYGTSAEMIVRLVNGQLPGVPQISFGVIDVRDVASLHLLAMTSPKASGQRFIAVSDEGVVWAKYVAERIKARLGERGKKVPTRAIPNLGYFQWKWED